MIIKVSQDHIDNGMKRNGCGCPIALAVKEATKESISIGSVWAVRGYGSNREFITLPSFVRDWINDYDMGAAVNPFEFEFAFELKEEVT